MFFFLLVISFLCPVWLSVDLTLCRRPIFSCRFVLCAILQFDFERFDMVLVWYTIETMVLGYPVSRQRHRAVSVSLDYFLMPLSESRILRLFLLLFFYPINEWMWFLHFSYSSSSLFFFSFVFVRCLNRLCHRHNAHSIRPHPVQCTNKMFSPCNPSELIANYTHPIVFQNN